ncbi:MAG: ABC transporter substrate-binding protein [Lamprobacter sp.]|uniref:ABC transporter substrate-binding protein n=1 Tax=Lamprobacter sp. TaxID=3100796 RepID=UPI002B262D96|nr:ABC transporter substrate-binding protein [Lamprobacter sp.]MEA3641839.1 ABC transporter substrate-binding protein [Lamprobacter sp.]
MLRPIPLSLSSLLLWLLSLFAHGSETSPERPLATESIASAVPPNAELPTLAQPLPSVISTNLCADLLLLRLAAPEQILSVSRQAQDPAQSPVAEIASAYPANRAAVEEMLYFQPDIALTYLGWSSRLHAELLADQGIRIVPLPYPRGVEDALAMTREIAQAIGREVAGAGEITNAQARIKALTEQLPARTAALKTLYLRPNGGTAGSETYIDALLGLLGLRNLAAEQGIRGWGTVPLEQLMLDPPDIFLLGYFDQAQPQSTARFGRHPLLHQLLARIPSIQLPSNSGWGCGGLELIDAAELIAEQLKTIHIFFDPQPAH